MIGRKRLLIIEILQIDESGRSWYPLPSDVLYGATRHVISVQKDKDESYMYDGYFCYGEDIILEVPRWEHRLWGDKKVEKVWLKFYHPYKNDLTTAIRETKQKFAKKNNPLDIIDAKAAIDILRQLYEEREK